MDEQTFIAYVLALEGEAFLLSDIDDVGSNTGRHWTRRAIETFGEERILRGRTIEEVHHIYKYIELAPWIQKDPEVCAHLRTYPHDPEAYHCGEIPGAVKFSRKIHEEVIPFAGYITARPRCVAEATRNQLRRLGFPNVPALHRPSNMLWHDAHKWKKSVLDALYPKVVGIVEDQNEMDVHLFGESENNVPYQGTLYHLQREKRSFHPRAIHVKTHAHLYVHLSQRFWDGRYIR